MKSIDIEKLKQLISRTDISGNDKVRWLTDFIDGRELQQQERMYSEEDMKSAFKVGFSIGYGSDVHAIDEKNRTCEEGFNKIKKK